MPQTTNKIKSRNQKAKRTSIARTTRKTSAASGWDTHPYRPFVEGLPKWIGVITLVLFSIVFLHNWFIAIVFSLLIIIFVALLFDLLHSLHIHLNVHPTKKQQVDEHFTRFGRGLLIGFTIAFLILFLLFAFGSSTPHASLFVTGSLLTLVGLVLSCFLLVAYIIVIPGLGFPRVRHQLSLATLLLFAYLYLFFAFAIRRVSL
jgi:hypothetical protein